MPEEAPVTSAVAFSFGAGSAISQSVGEALREDRRRIGCRTRETMKFACRRTPGPGPSRMTCSHGVHTMGVEVDTCPRRAVTGAPAVAAEWKGAADAIDTLDRGGRSTGLRLRRRCRIRRR